MRLGDDTLGDNRFGLGFIPVKSSFFELLRSAARVGLQSVAMRVWDASDRANDIDIGIDWLTFLFC